MAAGLPVEKAVAFFLLLFGPIAVPQVPPQGRIAPLPLFRQEEGMLTSPRNLTQRLAQGKAAALVLARSL